MSDQQIREMLRHLSRIDNAMRFLVKRHGFPNRCAFDNLRGVAEALRKAVEAEERHVDEAVERIMGGGDR